MIKCRNDDKRKKQQFCSCFYKDTMQTKTHLERKRQPEIRLRSQAITKTLDQNLKCKKMLLEHCILTLL